MDAERGRFVVFQTLSATEVPHVWRASEAGGKETADGDFGMQDDVNVYVICAAESLARGQAKAFSLSRVTEDEGPRPLSIFVVRTDADQFVGYLNRCPHEGAWLNIGDGKFFNEDGSRLRCGRHKAEFDIETGQCVKGPCRDKAIEPVALVVMDGDVCLCGIELAEEEPSAFWDDLDDTMEIMIHPG